jgi:hypothetical protein
MQGSLESVSFPFCFPEWDDHVPIFEQIIPYWPEVSTPQAVMERNGQIHFGWKITATDLLLVCGLLRAILGWQIGVRPKDVEFSVWSARQAGAWQQSSTTLEGTDGRDCW